MRRIDILGAVALVAVSACGGSEGESITQPGTRPTGSVSIVARAETRGTQAFNPNPVTVSVASGGLVSWYNDDEEPAGGDYGGTTGTIHNIVADDLSFSSGNIVPRGRFQQTFQVVGDHGYHCAIHPAMKGTITVAP
jgi:plastocyanin